MARIGGNGRHINTHYKLTLKTQTMAKKEIQISCLNCKYSDKNKTGDFMIWCNKLKVYRALGLRYCKLAWL